MTSSDIFTFVEHDPGGKVKLALPDDVVSSAVFSECKRYRYELHRRWKHDANTKSIVFLMMNPSTATHEVDDPTVKKCRMYAGQWGYNNLIVCNIMAYRATNPKDLLDIDDPVGPDNLSTIQRILEPRPFLLCAWGRIPAKLRYAENQVMALIKDHEPHVLRLNKSVRPWHPLYLRNDVAPTPWNLSNYLHDD